MKKYFFLAFIALFLFSCQNNQDTNTQNPIKNTSTHTEEKTENTQPENIQAQTQEETKETQKPTEETVLIQVSSRKLDVPKSLAKFFEGKNLKTQYAATTALIVYTDKDGNRIDNFKNIDQNSTAHIFADSYCYNRQEDKTIYLKSISCDDEKCTFPKYDNFTLEELEKKQDLFDLLETSPWTIQKTYLLHPQSGTIPLVFNAIQDCNDLKKRPL